MESEAAAAAADRGAVDKAIVSLLACCFRVGCAGRKRRRSAGRTCRTRRTAAASWSTSAGRKPTRTHRRGRALPQERLRRGAPPAPRPDHRIAVRAAPGADRAGARRLERPVYSRVASQQRPGPPVSEGRITGHSGRVGLASELTARGASTTETMFAGGWKTARMVAHYSAAATAVQGAVAKYL